MDEREQAELAELKRQQAELARQLQLLGLKLADVENRLKGTAPKTEFRAPPLAAQEKKVQPTAVPPPVLPASEPPKQAAGTPTFEALLNRPARNEPPPFAPADVRGTPPPLPAAAPTAITKATKTPSLEMRLGTYWLVRIGIVMLLTGLVFFGAYAYENFSGLIGPAGKVAVLYAVSALLVGAGYWLQRNQESMKNYGDVLLAGGLAAIYFTTYAAHHVARLMVIKSGLVDGGLLLVWAGFVIWLADRKKSEVLALFAVLLSYYTSVMTQVGQFTLYSNLVLTGATVFFLVKNRWATLSFVSLVATYLSYIFWRFYQHGEWHLVSAEAGLWTGIYFLAAYWSAFTVAVFLSRHKELGGKRRAAFLSLNNGAFFCAYVLTMLQVHHGDFWKFALIYGAVLVALAFVGRRFLGEDLLFGNTYLTQGVLLVTLGFITYYEGLRLSLVLAAESIVLVTLGKQMKSRVLDLASLAALALAAAWCVDTMRAVDSQGEVIGIIVGAAGLFNCWWLRERGEQKVQFDLVRRVIYSLLSLGLWYVVTHIYAEREYLAPVLALEAAVFAAAFYPLRLKEFSLLGQLFLPVSQALWLTDAAQNVDRPWWNPVAIILITLGMAAWWQRQKAIRLDATIVQVLLGVYAIALVALGYMWLQPKFDASTWLAMLSLLAVLTTLYAAFNRYWLLAAAGQIFPFLGAWEFSRQLLEGEPIWYFSLAPMAAPLVLALGALYWLKRHVEGSAAVRNQVSQLGLVYRALSVLMSIWWVHHYVPGRDNCWAYGLAGIGLFALAGWRKNQEILIFSAVYTLAALAVFWMPPGGVSVTAPNLFMILAVLAQQRVAHRQPAWFQMPREAHVGAIILGGLALWYYLSRWILLQQSDGFYLTAGWSVLALALFSVGMALKERIYRWLGLAILACALGRVVIFDVWRLEIIYRVLSFMALGIVLLVLGFIYNRYQEKIREWL